MVCSDIPSLPSAEICHERQIVSVVNLTRVDGEALCPLAAGVGAKTETTGYPLTEANTALDDLRKRRLKDAAILMPWFQSGRSVKRMVPIFRTKDACGPLSASL